VGAIYVAVMAGMFFNPMLDRMDARAAQMTPPEESGAGR
jgi:hypothetical protein